MTTQRTITLTADQWDVILEAVECYCEEGPPRLSAASAALSSALEQPEPEGPTDEEIKDWHSRCADLTQLGEAEHYWAFDLSSDEVAGVVSAALARWGIGRSCT